MKDLGFFGLSILMTIVLNVNYKNNKFYYAIFYQIKFLSCITVHILLNAKILLRS